MYALNLEITLNNPNKWPSVYLGKSFSTKHLNVLIDLSLQEATVSRTLTLHLRPWQLSPSVISQECYDNYHMKFQAQYLTIWPLQPLYVQYKKAPTGRLGGSLR